MADRLYPAELVVARPDESVDVIVHRHCNMRFLATDDTSTEPARSTNADRSSSRTRRGELHHRNYDFDRFNISRLDAIHLSTTSIQSMSLIFKEAH